mgnify:CR=1 FL=1
MQDMYLVIRDKGNVVVSIMWNRMDQSYHFVNLTKGHICSCAFRTVYDAIEDMKYKKDIGEIIDFIEIE